MRYVLRPLCLVLGVLVLAGATTAWGQIIPADRLVDWSPGVAGGPPAVHYSVSVLDHGAVGDGFTDDGPAFNAAIQAAEAPGFVWVPAGDYRIATIVEMRSGIVLQGAGPHASRLLFDLPSFGFRGGIEFDGTMEAAEIAVTSGHDFGSTELTLESVDGLAPGDLVWMFQNDDEGLMYTADYWRTNYSPESMGQIFEIDSVDGLTVTLDAGLRLDYRVDLNPRLRRIEPIEDAGVEGLYLERLDSADAYTISMTYARNCWVRYVESRRSYRSHVWVFFSRALTVSGSYFHEAWDYGGGGHGYGVTLGDCTSDVLVENNILRTLRHAMMAKEGANGNVFAYNYSFDNVGANADGSCHGHYNYANLFEGNVMRQIVVSDWWGPSGPRTTVFRNRLSDSEGVSVRDHSHKTNVVGNTTPRIEIRTGPDIILFGYPVYMGEVNDWLRDANLVNGNLDWSGAPAPPPIPASHYLDAPPSFWGTLPWPAVGADVDSFHEPDLRIPAQVRYDLIQAGDWRPPIPIILSQEPLVVDQPATLTVVNALPGETVWFAFGYGGEGDGPCLAGLGGLCLDVVDAAPLGTAVADDDGVAALTFTVPPPAGVEMTTQAVIRRGAGGSRSVESNPITEVVQ